MLIEKPRHTEIFGSVKIRELQRILKLDSGRFDNPHAKDIPLEDIKTVFKQLAIVIPTRNENIHLLDGVLRAIPFDCSIIVVSNSNRETLDAYKMERDIIRDIQRFTQQEMLVVHQKDPQLSTAFRNVSYEYLLNKDGLVRDGKSEAMIVGMLIARSLGKKFVGFVDADNYIPGSVREYVLDYAAGFCMSESPYSMVRLHWKYKPKMIEDKLYFKKWGRVSETTNKYLNLLLSTYTGFETRVVVTGNAGEHALTMELADILCYRTGYSIEPYHFVYLFDQFGIGTEDRTDSDALSRGIEVFQIETLNPHLHEEKGEEHVNSMLVSSLSTIYHSRLCNDDIKAEIAREVKSIPLDGPKVMNPIMPPIGEIDTTKFMDLLESGAETYVRFRQGSNASSE